MGKEEEKYMEGWKKHFWEREYFYDKDMVRDSHVSVAGNCFDQLAAIILKNTTDWIEDYDYIGLEDISIHVLFDKAVSYTHLDVYKRQA